MFKKIKNLSFIILPIALGVFFIWYSISKLSPSDIESIKLSFKTANYWWVALSLLFGVLSHFSRAYRWQFLLEPLGYKPQFANSVMAVLIAYLLNLFIPRSGEFARAASIKKYDKIPFDKAFGTIVAERVADALMLLSIIGIAFLLQTDLIGGYLFKDKEESSIISKIVFFIVIPLAGFFTYRILKKSKNKFIIKVISFINGLLDGVKSIVKMKKEMAIYFSHFVYLANVCSNVLRCDLCLTRNYKPSF